MNVTPSECGPQVRSPAPGTYPYYISLYVFPFCFFIGTIGNLLILTVLRKMKQKNNNAFLSAMALSDFFYFFPMLLMTLSAYDSLALDEGFLNFWYHSVTFIVASANWFSTASNWFVVCIAIERLAAIRNPLKTLSLWNSSLLTSIILSIFIISAVIQTPRFFGYSVLTSIHENKTVYCYVMEMGHVHYIMIRISRTVIPFITAIIPMILLSFLNGFLLYYLHRSRHGVVLMEYSNRNFNDTEARVTKLVLAILISFFILNFPATVVAISAATETNLSRLKWWHNMPAHTTNNMVTLSKVLNFFIYFCSSSQFRNKLHLMWTNFRTNRPSIWQSVSRRTSLVIESLTSSTKSKQKQSLEEVVVPKHSITMERETNV